MVEKREIEVAGHGEHIVDADLDEAAGKEAAKSGIAGDANGRMGCVFDGGRAVEGRATHIVVRGFVGVKCADHGGLAR